MGHNSAVNVIPIRYKARRLLLNRLSGIREQLRRVRGGGRDGGADRAGRLQDVHQPRQGPHPRIHLRRRKGQSPLQVSLRQNVTHLERKQDIFVSTCDTLIENVEFFQISD